MLAAGSAAEAATIDFGVTSFDGSITFLGGSSLDQSTTLDLDLAFLVVNEVFSGHEFGVALNDVVSLTASTSPTSGQIIYTFRLGAIGADVTLMWWRPRPGGRRGLHPDANHSHGDKPGGNREIGLELTGMVSDSSGSFLNVPVMLNLTTSESWDNRC